MASVFTRPGGRFYARYKDAAGKWVSRRVRQQTRREAIKVANALEAKAERQRLGLEAPESAGVLVGPLMKKWALSLSNRSADIDRGRIDLHVMPRWRAVRIADIKLATVTAWLDDLAEAGELAAGTRRHLLGLLSRFLGWAQQRGHVERNVTRDLSPGSRPRPVLPPPESIPWLSDDADVLRIMAALPAVFAAIFFVGNRSGARLGEILSLRVADLDEIEDGWIRIRFAGEDGDGPLKEDKHGVAGRPSRPKYAPIPAADARAVLAPILAARRAAGAVPAAFVFVDADGDRINRHAVTYQWRKVREALGLPTALNFYRGTRHSAASRAQSLGASADQIAEALGHSSASITRKHYMHAERPRFNPILRASLGLDGAPGATVIPIGVRTQATETAATPAATVSEGDTHAA
jgi:integrase